MSGVMDEVTRLRNSCTRHDILKPLLLTRANQVLTSTSTFTDQAKGSGRHGRQQPSILHGQHNHRPGQHGSISDRSMLLCLSRASSLESRESDLNCRDLDTCYVQAEEVGMAPELDQPVSDCSGLQVVTAAVCMS